MRARVNEAVIAVGYEPDLVAQSLRTGSTRTVGFIVGNISNTLFAEIASGAERRFRADGYTMLLANGMGGAMIEQEHLRQFTQRRVDGLLLSLTDDSDSAETAPFRRASVPTVLIDRDLRHFPESSAVLSDHGPGIEEAVKLLIDLGHRRIGLVSGDLRVRPARERAAAIRRTVRRYDGVSAVVRSGKFTAEHGQKAVTAMLREDNPPTAVIAGSNQILVGVLRGLREAGLTIPRDISLITCDQVALSEFLVPPLATIMRDHYAMGYTGADLLLERLHGGSARTVFLPTTFVATDSCAPPVRQLRRNPAARPWDEAGRTSKPAMS
jgi:LacI family transcriptional regulator